MSFEFVKQCFWTEYVDDEISYLSGHNSWFRWSNILLSLSFHIPYVKRFWRHNSNSVLIIFHYNFHINDLVMAQRLICYSSASVMNIFLLAELDGILNFTHTVYPKKYAHGFVVLCFVVVMQSFIMNSHEVFIHIHQGCFAGTWGNR